MEMYGLHKKCMIDIIIAIYECLRLIAVNWHISLILFTNIITFKENTYICIHK